MEAVNVEHKKKIQKVPQLRFPEFSEPIDSVLLGKVSDVRDGTHDSPKYVDKGYPLITSKNLLESGELDYENVNLINEIDYIKINKRSIVDTGDILFGMIGTIGNPVMIKKTGFAIKNVVLIKQKSQLLNSYLIHYLNGPNIAKQFYSENTGGTQKFIALGIIRMFSIATPSLPEQKKIASFLSAVDQKIQQLTRKKELLELYKKGVMQKIFPPVGGQAPEIRFRNENGNNFPDWEEKRLGELAEIRRGASPRPISDPKWFDPSSKIGWVRISDVTRSNKYLDKTEQYLSEEGIRKSRLVEKGNMIMSICATIGKSIYTNFKVCIHDGFVVFENLKANKEYLYYFLDKIQLSWYKYGQPGTQVNLNTNIVGNENIPYPSFPEQKRIAGFLSSIDEKIEFVKNNITQTQKFKKGLLQQMFV